MSKYQLSKIIFCILLLMTLSTLSMLASEDKENPLPILNTKLKTIAVFKNGLGFFIREGQVELQDKWAVTESVPQATLGSLWIGSLDEDTQIEEVIAFFEEIKSDTEAITLQELLKANIGKRVTVTANNKLIEGTIKSIPEDRVPYPESMQQPIPPQPAVIVIISTKKGEVAINRNAVSKIEFPPNFSTKILTQEKAKRFKFKLATRKKKATLSLSYLQKGISWIPGYLVNIENPKKARITMKAILINDIEDLENADAFFVVGYPNFMYADVLSPMALDQALSQFITGLEEGTRRRDEYSLLSNIMRQARTSISVVEALKRSSDYGYTATAIKGVPGASEEDLFLYHKKGISLRKGERAYYHIFSQEVDYKHIYEWNVPDTINVDTSGYQFSEESQADTEQVWHSIKLGNSTDYPWTTAPALTVSGWKPLAQDVINYTPKGTETNLKLTVATDIKTNRNEYEIERERDVKLYRSSYDLVTIKGELYIHNAKSQDVTLEIKKKVTGDVREASHDGKIDKVAEGLRGVNLNSFISWEIPVKAGEEVEVTYTYKVYIERKSPF
ncbi:MAG: hypothetical protein JSW00_12135 [Thermoplasmata archaeon]|nr:MAG: hypothetical protein JSW00_12135 [Thermoplasmata archaeon]